MSRENWPDTESRVRALNSVTALLIDWRGGDERAVQKLLPLESAQFVFVQGSGDYAVLAPQALIPSIVDDLQEASAEHPGSTKVYVVSTGEEDIRNALAS